MRLFEITSQFKSLESLSDTDDIPPEALLDTLESLEGLFADKAVAVAKFILSLEASAEAIEAAADAMKLRSIRLGKRADNIRAYLLLQFQIMQEKKIETPELRISRQNNPVAVQISDETAVPANFWVQPEPPPKRIDKKSIKEALQSGAEVAGCYLEAGERIAIKV